MSIDMGGPTRPLTLQTAFSDTTAGAGSTLWQPLWLVGWCHRWRRLWQQPQQKLLARRRTHQPSQYVMGAFITEGVIPFAAANPLKVIPIIAVSAGVVPYMLFGIVSKVPHGGVFAMLAGGVMNPLLYLAIWVGASSRGLPLINLRKPNKNKLKTAVRLRLGLLFMARLKHLARVRIMDLDREISFLSMSKNRRQSCFRWCLQKHSSCPTCSLSGISMTETTLLRDPR